MLNNINISNGGKFQLTSTLKFMASKDTVEQLEMHFPSSNLEIMVREYKNSHRIF